MKSRLLVAVVGTLCLICYVNTLAPTITWQHAGADSGDLATAVAVGGVPHPPGYPTYLLLGELAKGLPWGDVAYRLNLLSAVCGALTAGILALVVARTLSSAAPKGNRDGWMVDQPALVWPCALSAGLALAFSGPLWSQAVIAEVYALNSLFAAALLYGAVRIRPGRARGSAPLLFGLLGVALGNHPTILLLLPLLIWGTGIRWRPRLAASALLALCLGLSVYLIIPLRAAAFPPVNWGGAVTWRDFLWLVSGQLYRPFAFGLPWELLPGRLLSEARLLAVAFLGWGLPVGLLGLWRLARARRSLARSSLASFLLFSAYAVSYNTTDSYVYLLPACVIFAWWIGWGLYDLAVAVGERMPPQLTQTALQRRKWAVWGALALLPLLSLAWNLPVQDLSEDYEAYDYAVQSLELVPQGGVIVVENDPQTFALWYARYGLGRRPEVAVVSPNLLPFEWYRETLRRTHPSLRLADPDGQPVTALADFIRHNTPQTPVYLADVELSVTQEGGREVKQFGPPRRDTTKDSTRLCAVSQQWRYCHIGQEVTKAALYR